MFPLLFLLHFATFVPFARPDYNFKGNSNYNDDTWTESSLQHRMVDNSYHLPRITHPEYPGSPYSHCRKPAKCVHMSNSTCMGTRLPYDTTTFDLIPYYTTEEAIREKLYLLQSLKHIPKCWAVVQPFLCSIFMPKCINETMDLPSQEICRIVSGPCRIIFNHTIWPSFIRCEDAKTFPKSCKNEIREIKFNTSGKCLDPLVHTDNQLAIFEGVEGCGMPCSDPLYTQDEKTQIHSFISYAAGICCFFNLFTVVTFLIDWRSANKYPALVIFYINCCFMVFCIGWLLQFTRGSREVIVCRKDNTLRMSEPSGENLSCVVVFVLVYYSIMAAMVWFVVLTYTWHMTFQALGKIQDRIDKKGAYFHLLAWCLPLMLTVTVMALGEIDGNYVTGICFVGYNNHVVRAWFVLGPVTVVMLICGYFLSRSLITLIRLKISSQEVISERVSSKIRETIVRMGLFSVFIFVTVIITFYCHIYEFKHSWGWKQSFRDYMMCSITSKYSDMLDCKIEYRPSAGKLQLHLLAPFFAGILMSSWVWTSSTVDTWMRFFKRIFNREPEEPVKLKKHKVIAQAFAKRKMFNSDGRLSITFHNTHEDPVGLNFDLNSVASQDFSSTWAAALPKLVTRRGALVGGSMSSNRRNSTDSQYSFSLRRVSVESRRNSCDSQFALSFSEMKADFKTSRVKNSNKRRKKPPERTRKRSESYKRNARKEYEKSRTSKMISAYRRGSTTSQESQLGVQILSALSIGAATNTAVPLPMPNMKRRPGVDQGTLALKDAERLLPFLFTGHSHSDVDLSSDEKPNTMMDKEMDLEIGNKKSNRESDNEESQIGEETKMLEPEAVCNRSKSKISNKSSDRNDRRISMECQTKYLLEDEKALKHLLQDSDDDKIKNESINEKDRKSKSIVESNLSYSPDLTRLLQHDGQSNAREMATQTLPLKMLEMEALNQSIDEIINSRSCSSRGTQVPSQMKKNKKQPK